MTPAPRTVVEAFLPADGAAALDQLYDTANAAGLDDQPVRLTIRRMVAAGEVTQSGRGRRGTLALTATGRERLRRDRLALHLALAQDRGQAPWDSRWRLLAVSVPETDRAARDAMRRDLLAAGAAPVSTGLYASPHDLSAMLGPLDTSATVAGTPGADTPGTGALFRAIATDLDVRGVTDPAEIAEMLWPAAPIIDRYAVADRAVELAGSLRPGADTRAVLLRQLRLADAWELAMRQDPLIPPELRGDPWPPATIRRRWHTAWTELAAQLPDQLLYRGWLP
ncbi:PaaX family transcriptional regulator [Actinoplanes sp. SE50]|uniref:PaaX family transcriptional regulator n=1 Tax=unclassified Actinoplanes TaxID=2626549 RepID=UPI00023EC746|nr:MULTISPECIES: PaaX family transcriptional regulator [unclassified Actinoplanes]AEV82549.1 phenylacetic acid degradation operon negative regulatory protein [Actinoplanes sp. SE50/110]ATO80945.1 PaaX family transcriptional regulator [Actinoplanes sp. SE50]SLL98352.1 PaaX family transcriptional regulator [Actinoplanes sp. SE50/110]